MNVINLILSAVPIVGQTASEVVALIAGLKAAAAAHGYDLDTQAIDARIAEDARRQQIAIEEAGGAPTE